MPRQVKQQCLELLERRALLSVGIAALSEPLVSETPSVSTVRQGWPHAPLSQDPVASSVGVTLDSVVFGNTASESAHSLVSSYSQAYTGALGQTARRLTPQSPVTVNGGWTTVTMAVDPLNRNYFSVKLWGGDDTDQGMGRLYLYLPIDGTEYQVGYRHEGDYAPLSVTAGKPPLPGRFFYSTTALPLTGPAGTLGKTSMTFKIQSTGELYGLGSGGPPSGNYQFNMDTNSRGIYRAYTHTDPLLDVSGETQGTAPSVTTRPATSDASVLGSSGTYTTGLNNWITGRLSTAITAFTASDVQLLAQSYGVSALTAGYNNAALISKVISVIDGFASDWYTNPGNVSDPDNYGASGGNEVWGGRFGALGWAIHLLKDVPAFSSSLDTVVSYGTVGGSKARRIAWGDMLVASRDFGRTNRDGRAITNQSILADLNIYKANRALIDLGNANALSETGAQRYLKESSGILPWLGSDILSGGSSRKFGDNYYLVTTKGVTREYGYAGGYSEMPLHIAMFYKYTGNSEFRDQSIKMLKAIANMRRPAVEVSGANNYRSMERIGLLAWRGVREADGFFANDISYASGVGWSAGMIVAGKTLDPYAIGFAKQMLADNQYLNNLTANPSYYASPTFDALYAMEVYDDYYAVKNAVDSGIRLPMTDGQPDFAWSDEENGLVIIKKGSEKLWIEPYWQGKTGTGINGIGRFHYSTSNYDQYGVFETNPQFDFSGSTFVRPNLIDMPERNGYVPPDNPAQAYAGEKLPVGNELSSNDQSAFRGKADFYGFRFGRYLIGVNASTSRTFDLLAPSGFTSATDLVSNTVKSGQVTVSPSSTVVLYLTSNYDIAPVPTAPLLLEAQGSASQITLNWSMASNATKYNVKRSFQSHGPYVTIASNVVGTTYIDTSVTVGSTYSYVVTGANTNGESYPSGETTASAGLPSPWAFQDIGTVNLTGSSNVLADGTIRLAGSGSGIGGTSDSFHFAYVPITGNASIISKVSKMNTGGVSQAGVMIRESLSPDAKLAAIHFEDGGNMRLLRRTTTGGAAATSGSLNSYYKSPGWIRLDRMSVGGGNYRFDAFYSVDGVSWGSAFSTQTFAMNSNAYIGLDASSRTSIVSPAYDQLLVGNFQNVQILPVQQGAASYPFETSSNRVDFSFTADVSTSLSTGDLQLTRIGGGPVPTIQSVTWDATSRTASFAMTSTPADGNYTATLPANSVTDSAGNTISSPFSVSFFVLLGDANRDRKVNTQDFNIFVSHFGGSSRTFSQGNFNYDLPGNVDSQDFNLFVSQYGRSVPAPAEPMTAAIMRMASSPFASLSFNDITDSTPENLPIIL